MRASVVRELIDARASVLVVLKYNGDIESLRMETIPYQRKRCSVWVFRCEALVQSFWRLCCSHGDGWRAGDLLEQYF